MDKLNSFIPLSRSILSLN